MSLHIINFTDIGDVFAWGWNSDGQLGFPCQKLRENNRSLKRKHNEQSETQTKKDSGEKSPPKERVTQNNQTSNTEQISPSSSECIMTRPSEGAGGFGDIMDRTKTLPEHNVLEKEENTAEEEEEEMVNILACPRLVEFENGDDLIISSIACGSRHSVCVSGK